MTSQGIFLPSQVPSLDDDELPQDDPAARRAELKAGSPVSLTTYRIPPMGPHNEAPFARDLVMLDDMTQAALAIIDFPDDADVEIHPPQAVLQSQQGMGLRPKADGSLEEVSQVMTMEMYVRFITVVAWKDDTDGDAS